MIDRRDLGDETAVLVSASSGRARGDGCAGRARPRDPHTARSSRSRPASRTRSSSRTKRSRASRSIGVEPADMTDEVLGAVWGQVQAHAKAPHRASRHAPREHLPRRRRRGVDDRLRVQRARRIRPAARERRRRVHRLVVAEDRRRAGRRARRRRRRSRGRCSQRSIDCISGPSAVRPAPASRSRRACSTTCESRVGEVSPASASR